jgi:excisionase family DNA binding protein
MGDDLIEAGELARKLRLKPSTVLAWAKRGVIPSRRLSRKVIRFDYSEVMAALDKRAAQSEAEGGAA